jgi:hypothetical protein
MSNGKSHLLANPQFQQMTFVKKHFYIMGKNDPSNTSIGAGNDNGNTS